MSKHSFKSKLERIAEGINYFAIPVPAKITRALATRGPVPVSARVNGSKPFLVSLYPKGNGSHGMRVKAAVRAQAGAEEGDAVAVEITVLDREKTKIPADLIKALKAAGALDAFNATPKGKMAFTIRKIDEAKLPETRAKRIAAAVAEAKKKAPRPKAKSLK